MQRSWHDADGYERSFGTPARDAYYGSDHGARFRRAAVACLISLLVPVVLLELALATDSALLYSSMPVAVLIGMAVALHHVSRIISRPVPRYMAALGYAMLASVMALLPLALLLRFLVMSS